MIELTYDEFKELVSTNLLKSRPIETRLFHKLSGKHKGRYKEDVKAIYANELPLNNDKMMELYARTRLIIDYISGMTDQFALEEFQNLSAIK